MTRGNYRSSRTFLVVALIDKDIVKCCLQEYHSLKMYRWLIKWMARMHVLSDTRPIISNEHPLVKLWERSGEECQAHMLSRNSCSHIFIVNTLVQFPLLVLLNGTLEKGDVVITKTYMVALSFFSQQIPLSNFVQKPLIAYVRET